MCELNRMVRPCVAERVQQLHHVHPLARVHAVERLVQQQHLRVVHQRGGDPGALPHALGVGARSAGPARRSSRPARAPAGRPPPGRAAGAAWRWPSTNSLRGQEAVHRLALADQAELRGRRPGCARSARRRRSPSPRDGGEEAGHHVQHRGLAGAVRAEQAGDARRRGSCVTSLTATTLPYQRDTFCSSTVLTARPPSGSGSSSSRQAATRATASIGVHRAELADDQVRCSAAVEQPRRRPR